MDAPVAASIKSVEQVTEEKAFEVLKKYFLGRRGYTPDAKGRSPEWDFCSKDIAYAKARVNMRDPYYGDYPIFHLAYDYEWGNIEAGFRTIISYLKVLGASLDVRDRHRSSVLHHYIRQREPPVINAFINEGADVNAQDSDGYTPMSLILTCSGSTSSAILLCEAGANFFINNNRGKNAYDYWRGYSHGVLLDDKYEKKFEAEAQKFSEYRYEENRELAIQATKNRDLLWLLNLIKNYKGENSLFMDACLTAAEAGDADFLEELLDEYESKLCYPTSMVILEKAASAKVVEVVYRYTDEKFVGYRPPNKESAFDYDTIRLATEKLWETKEHFEKSASQGHIGQLEEILSRFKDQPQGKRGGPRSLRLNFSDLLQTSSDDVVKYFTQLPIPDKCYISALYWAAREGKVNRIVLLLSRFNKFDIIKLSNKTIKRMDRIGQAGYISAREAREKIFPAAFLQLPVMNRMG